MPHMANLPWLMGTMSTLFLIIFIWSQTFYSQKIQTITPHKDHNKNSFTKHWQW